MSKILTKQSGRVISQSVTASTLLESKMQKKAITIPLDGLNMQSAIHKVDEIIEQKKDNNKELYKLYFKLYMLQNYKIELKYYKGCNISKTYLNNLKSLIKTFTVKGTVWKSTCISNKMIERIQNFVTEIKEIIKPFPLCGKKRSSIQMLLNSPISSVEKDYIISNIGECKKKATIQSITTVNKTTKRKRGRVDFEALVRLYNKPVSVMMKELNISNSSAKKYKTYCNNLEKGKVVRGCSKTLVELFNNTRHSERSNESITVKKVQEEVKTQNIQPKQYAMLIENVNEMHFEPVSEDFAKGYKTCYKMCLDSINKEKLDSSSFLNTPFKLIEFKYI